MTYDKLIISTDFGIGRILRIERPRDLKRDFYVIESDNGNTKYYLPVEGKSNFRFISSRSIIEKGLKKLNNCRPLKNFTSKKERIEYFKEKFSIMDVFSIVKTIRELKDLEDRGTMENKILSKLIDTFALEVSIVLKMQFNDTRKMIMNSLEKINS